MRNLWQRYAPVRARGGTAQEMIPLLRRGGGGSPTEIEDIGVGVGAILGQPHGDSVLGNGFVHTSASCSLPVECWVDWRQWEVPLVVGWRQPAKRDVNN